MSDNPFYRLAPFIQEFIYRKNWAELHPIQIEACRVIFDTDAHLLLATGTASGKTEAAFLPVLTILHQSVGSGLGALYIGPLKALINDQFVRLNELLKEADIPVWHWHGDVSEVERKRFLAMPRGILQITPESLESFLINRSAKLAQMMPELKFIVIDEVHALMGSDRGRQILCQIERLSPYVRAQPRRIGLSATLGDSSFAEDWLRSGTCREVITPKVAAGQQRIRLAVEHFIVPGVEQDNEPQSNSQQAPLENNPPYYDYIYGLTLNKKAIIFANNRGETESVISELRHIAEVKRAPDIYHVHHSSISASLREAAEQAMRDPLQPAVTAATLSLELGIDIGQLERVLQLEAPFGVASFLQRLGRSGRRGQPAEMWCVCKEEFAPEEELPEQIPWSLLQAISVIQLYLEERWIEPVRPIKLPLNVLYQQTMSILLAAGELSPAVLAQRVLELTPFRHVSQQDFQELLRYLISLDHIERTEDGTLIVGLAGEKVTGSFHFYAVFRDDVEFTVYEEGQQVGTIVNPPPIGERFGLAGRAWEVIESDSKRRVVMAKRIRGRVSVKWRGSGGEIHSRILQRMRQALAEDIIYPYLQSGAKARLEQARALARTLGLANKVVFSLSETRHCIFPWVGTVFFRTLTRILQHASANQLQGLGISGFSPYYLIATTRNPVVATEFASSLSDLLCRKMAVTDLIGPEEEPQSEKYDEFVPASLLRRGFAMDRLDLHGLAKELPILFPQQQTISNSKCTTNIV